MPASIHHQIDRALGAITWGPEKIKAFKKETGSPSVKKPCALAVTPPAHCR